jgi:hypothetical protein
MKVLEDVCCMGNSGGQGDVMDVSADNKERMALEDYYVKETGMESKLDYWRVAWRGMQLWDWRYIYVAEKGGARARQNTILTRPSPQTVFFVGLDWTVSVREKAGHVVYGFWRKVVWARVLYISRDDIEAYTVPMCKRTKSVAKRGGVGGDDQHLLVAIFLHDNVSRPFKSSDGSLNLDE